MTVIKVSNALRYLAQDSDDNLVGTAGVCKSAQQSVPSLAYLSGGISYVCFYRNSSLCTGGM